MVQTIIVSGPLSGGQITALIGRCGTKYPGWWRNPPKPDPEPWWSRLAGGVIGAGAGILVYGQAGDLAQSAGILAAALPAFAAGAVSQDLWQMAQTILPARKAG